jgi:hypothetical protein
MADAPAAFQESLKIYRSLAKGALALMLAGLGLIGFMARRKKMENLKRY